MTKQRLVIAFVALAGLLAVGLLLPLPAWVSGDAALRPDPLGFRQAPAGILEREEAIGRFEARHDTQLAGASA